MKNIEINMLVDILRFINLCYLLLGIFFKGDFRVILGIGDGVCLEWRGLGNGGGLLRWYVFWLLLYFVSIFEDVFIRFMGEFSYDVDIDGNLCCCWLVVILLGGYFWFGKLFVILLLV